MNVEKRQEIERKVVRHLIRSMKEKGWSIKHVDDGGDRVKCATEKEAMDTVFSVDDATIRFRKGDIQRAVYIVLGNDGWDCICDHSMSDPDDVNDDFEKIMDEVSEYADQFCE